jgi:hypothetical protein
LQSGYQSASELRIERVIRFIIPSSKGQVMKLRALIAIALLSVDVHAAAQTVGTPAPAPTEQQQQRKMREVFVNKGEVCPRSSATEIVVCKSAEEQFRIPKTLRSGPAAGQTWGQQQQALQGVGAAGPGTCSTVGMGGGSGCMHQEFQNFKAAKKQKQAEAAAEDEAIHP